MNKKEQIAYDKLKRENEYLRAELDKHFEIYRQQLYEIVELKTKRDRVSLLAAELLDEAAI
jgi:adenosine deaminase